MPEIFLFIAPIPNLIISENNRNLEWVLDNQDTLIFSLICEDVVEAHRTRRRLAMRLFKDVCLFVDPVENVFIPK